MSSVLIFGAGQVAEVFAEVLTSHGFRIAAFVVDAAYWEPAKFIAQAPVVAYENLHLTSLSNVKHFVVGMSFRGLNTLRAAKFAAMRQKGFEPLTFVDQHARVAPSAKIGAGSFIFDGNVIQSGVEIGENCVLWSSNHVGHHSKIGDHVWVSSHAVISGAVEIGECTFVGVNATITDNRKLGCRNVIGAGALITRNTANDEVYAPHCTEKSSVPSYKLRGF